jgi:hypothetical protein
MVVMLINRRGYGMNVFCPGGIRQHEREQEQEEDGGGNSDHHFDSTP